MAGKVGFVPTVIDSVNNNVGQGTDSPLPVKHMYHHSVHHVMSISKGRLEVTNV